MVYNYGIMIKYDDDDDDDNRDVEMIDIMFNLDKSVKSDTSHFQMSWNLIFHVVCLKKNPSFM